MTSHSSSPLPHRTTTTTLTTMMMIRSTHIPIILNRICDDRHILSALLVTADGELLGSAAAMAGTTVTRRLSSPESLGTLLADIAWDYHRLGDELATLLVRDEPNSNAAVPSKMECLFMELEEGMVGISSCCMTSNSVSSSSSSSSSSDSSHAVGCFVMVICTPDAPLGWVRQRLQTVTNHIQDSLSLSSSSILTTTTTANSNNNNIDHQNTLTGS